MREAAPSPPVPGHRSASRVPPATWWAVTALGAWMAFGLAAVLASRTPAMAWERSLSAEVGWELTPRQIGWRSGEEWVVAVAIGVGLVVSTLRSTRPALAVALCAGPALFLLETVVKPLVGRPSGPDAFGFPSGHAAGAAFVAVIAVTALWGTSRIWRALLVVGGITLALACARDALATHSHLGLDIVGAWLWVSAWAASAMVIVSWRRRAHGPPHTRPSVVE